MELYDYVERVCHGPLKGMVLRIVAGKLYLGSLLATENIEYYLFTNNVSFKNGKKCQNFFLIFIFSVFLFPGQLTEDERDHVSMIFLFRSQIKKYYFKKKSSS